MYVCVIAADSNYHYKPLVAPAGRHRGGKGEKGREERAVRYLGFPGDLCTPRQSVAWNMPKWSKV